MTESISPRPSTASDRGQVNTSAAEIYAEFFVPALFADWPPHLMRAAQIAPGQRVVDIACGTGVLTRTVYTHAGAHDTTATDTADTDTGTDAVVGVDINAGMLAVAQRSAPQIDWRMGAAEALPLDDNSFDAAVSQFGLMFFDDRIKALQEMARVVRPGGRIAVAVWDTLDHTPGYAAMVNLLRRLFGDAAADALRAPYCLGDVATLTTLFHQAGLDQAQIATLPGQARFPSLADWVYTDIRGWTLADSIDDQQFAQLQADASHALAEFVQPDGSVAFAAPAHIVTVAL